MNSPKLRFKEFDDEWEQYKIEDTFENISIKNHPEMVILTIIQGKGTIPRNQSNRNIIFDEEKSFTYKVVNKSDFIIHLRSFEGGLEMSNHNGIVSPAYTILRGNNKVISLFFKYYFRTNKFINGVLSKSVEGIRDGRQISYNQLKDFYIPVPSIEEQTKIANFLSLIDRKIEIQEKLVENLKLYKKGLLQKVFSNNQGWKSAKLGDLTEYYTSNLTFQSLMNINNGNYPVYDASGICNYINTYQFNFKYIAIIKDGAGVGRIQLCNEYSSVIGTLGVLKVKKCNTNYLYYALQTINLKQNIVGTTIPHIYYKDYKNKLISCPNIEKQTKIANLFSTLDRKIELETNRLTKLKEYKKGLLQKMFI